MNRIEERLDDLEPHGAFLRDIRPAGGTATLIIQWLGDDYFGDAITKETLARLVRLDLDLGIECFVVPQSG